MKRWAFPYIFFIVILAITIPNYDTVSYASETVSPYVLSDLQYESYPGFSRILFASNQRLDFITYELQDPYRIVVDLIGVSFCELQENAEYDTGLVKKVDIIQAPYVKHPEGLDKYFYGIDYIIITPNENYPYSVSTSDDGQVIAIDIGEKAPPKLHVSTLTVLEDPKEKVDSEYKDIAEDSIGSIMGETLTEKDVSIPDLIDEDIIDNIYYETLDDAAVIIFSTNRPVDFNTSIKQYPSPRIVIKPKLPLYTDLENEIDLGGHYTKRIKIAKDHTIEKPDTLDSYFYPVRQIIIEQAKDLPYDFYSNDDKTISILELYYPKAVQVKKDLVEEDKAQPETKSGQAVYEDPTLEVYDEEVVEVVSRRELVRELKDQIKEEGLLNKEKIAKARREEEERKKLLASHMSESIGKELLKDLIVRGEGQLSLKESQDIALENSPEAKSSKEEIKVAKLKIKETFRALFPSVKFKASHTTGDQLDTVSFTEELYGVEAEHPLYQGGRLKLTYEQSKVNLNLAGARYRKVENEIDYKVAESYYSVVTSIMNVRLQKDLLEDAKGVLDKAERRYQHGLSTQLEMLNVKSNYNQIQFQLATADRDLALARFKLKQAMALEPGVESIDLSEVDTELPFRVIDVDLAHCLQLAAENQPDIAVNKLLVESNDYEERITKGKEGLKVDLTGWYGAADSYYDTEPKNLETDWSVGFKVTKPFGVVTPSYSFTKDKTSRKIGQTDRTGSMVHSGELAILDKDTMSIKSEIAEAKVNKMKAENDLIQTRNQTELDVKEAYYNYQEAILQVKNAIEKVRFQEEAVKVAKAQAQLNEALQSQQIEALVKLTDEKSVYVKALSDYNLSIAKLNKAIGIKEYFRID